MYNKYKNVNEYTQINILNIPEYKLSIYYNKPGLLRLIFNFLLFLKKIIVVLQCYVSFRCTEQSFSYIYIYFFFQILFSIIGYYKILSVVSCAIEYVLVEYPFFIIAYIM